MAIDDRAVGQRAGLRPNGRDGTREHEQTTEQGARETHHGYLAAKQ